MKDRRYLCIEGNIGSGKTTLCRLLAEKKAGRLVLEQFADNPFLPMFYDDPERFAFSVELFFMAERYKQLQEQILHPQLFDQLVISDYLFDKTRIFAHQNLNEHEFMLFRRLFDILYTRIPKPDLVLYLHRSPEVLLQFIARRGRVFEQKITANYLQGIQHAYFNFFKGSTEFPVVILHLENQSFEHDSTLLGKLETLTEENFSAGIHHIEPGQLS